VDQLQALLRTVEVDADGLDHPRLRAGWIHDVGFCCIWSTGRTP
jgi:hypothetical protein